MLNFNMKQSPETDIGGYGATSTPVPPPPNQGTPAPQANTQATGSDDNLDSYGYEIKKDETVAPAKVEEKKVDPPTEQKLEGAVAGYGKDAIKIETQEVIPPVDNKVLDYELEIKTLPNEDIIKLKKFASDNKLTKEAAQALVVEREQEFQQYKAEVARIEETQKQQVAQQKASWDQELRAHPEFGGANFEHSLLKVQKVLSTFMPNTNKVLTERGSMLPPYVMRDLASVYSHLHGTDKLVQGDVAAPITETKDSSPLDFYE